MADTRILPSATGGALTSATGVILETMLARDAAERQEAHQTRQLDIADRANAINQFVTLAGFTPPGTTLGDLGHIGRTLFQRGWGMAPDGVEDLELNPKTLQGMLERTGIEGLESGDDSWQSLVLPSIRGIMGLETSEDVANLRDFEARTKMNALTEITEDPELMEEYVFRALGRDPVTLRIPGVGGAPDREIQMQSTEMAKLYAAFLMARERFSMELRATEGDQVTQLVDEIKDAVAAADHSIGSTVIQGRILPMYQEAVQSGDTSRIQEFLDNPNVTEGEKYAIQFLIGSIGAGEEAFLSSLPPELANFWRIGSRLRELMPPEDFMEIMPSVTENLQPGFSATMTDKWFEPMRLEFSRGGQPGVTQEGTTWTGGGAGSGTVPGTASLDLSQVPREDLMTVVQDAVVAGEMTIEDLPGVGVPEDIINELFPPLDHSGTQNQQDNARVAALPEGGLDPDTVPDSIRDEVINYNRGLEAQAALSRPSPVIQQRLERTRRNIDARLQFAIRNEPVDVSSYETERERAIARRMNVLIKVRTRATDAERIRQLGTRIEEMAEELNRAGS